MTNATVKHFHRVESAHATSTCPTCGSPITEERYEKILRISEARQKQLADEHAAIERERTAIVAQRANIAAAAVAAERSKWEAEAACSKGELERARREAAAEQNRLAAAHERELQEEIRRREVQEQELRRQLKTLEQRRHRDEEVMKRTIAELARKAESRDRAHFGPEGEEDLVHVLRNRFPADSIERCGKAGDVLHAVRDGSRHVGTIVYENKNTKGWQRAYVRQTKRAMEVHGTPYGVLVSRAMPSGESGLCVVSGVVVSVPSLVGPVVAVLRDGIVAISKLRLPESGKAAKVAALLEYVRGDDFRSAIRRVQDKLAELAEDLNREKSYHHGWWAKRENHYATILRSAAGIEARLTDLLRGDDVASVVGNREGRCQVAPST